MLTYAFGLFIVFGGTRRLLVLRHRSDDEPLRLHHLLFPRRGVRVQQVLVPVERGGIVWKLGSLAFSGVDVEGNIVWYLAAGGLNCRASVSLPTGVSRMVACKLTDEGGVR